MCGIAGCIPANPTLAKKMAESLRHRGPDFAGHFEGSGLSMAHTLLAIRAAAGISMQPVENGGSPFVLAFNGQLYNTRAMREKLGQAYANVELDTALLYGLIEKYGWSFVEHIHGMYAIALYNKVERELRLYRDQGGQKCIYYYHKGAGFIFASEIKAILANPAIDRSVDEEAVAHALSIGYLPGEKTLFRHIKKVLPGECIAVKDGTVKKTMTRVPADGYYGDRSLSEVLTDVVREHLQSKYAISVNLSGGLDSSLLAYEAHRLGKKVEAYSTYFSDAPENYNRDFELAKRLSADYGLPFHPVAVTKESYLSNFIDSYQAVEEPNYNISVPVYYHMAKREGIRGDGLRVVMSGDGGDEVFGGYPHHRIAKRIEDQLRFIPRPLFNLIKNYRNGSHLDYGNPIELWLQLRKLKSQSVRTITADTKGYLQSITAVGEGSLLSSVMLLDRLFWMAGENFLRSDKLYMSQSMEMRCPLSYQPLRDHLDRTLSSNDYINEAQNKLTLRKTYEGKLPDYITKRPDKTGWRAPVKEWYGKDMKNLFLSILTEVKHNDALIDWKGLIEKVEKGEQWPGKEFHALLSLAILAKHYTLPI